MRARAAAVVTALCLVAAVTPADGTEHPVNPLTGVALSPCFSADHGIPVVRSIRLSRSTVDVTERAQTVEVIVDVVDTGGPGDASGVTSVTLYEGLEPMHRTADGTWRTSLRARQGSSPSNLYLYAVATDRAGNSSPGPGPYGYTPEPQAVLQVVSAAAPDDHDPRLRRVRLSRTTVDALSARRTVEVSVLARDHESGVFAVSMWLVHDDGRTPEVRLRRVSGDKHRGRWAGRVRVPFWASAGRWRPAFSAQDRFGRLRLLTAASDDAGLPLPKLRVRSGADSVPPTLRSVSLAPSTVDVRAGSRTVVIDVRARDDQSGVAAVELDVDAPSGTITLPTRLTAGTRRNGLWRASLAVSSCAAAADLVVRVAGITDRRGLRYNGYNHPTASGRTLTVVNADRVVPAIASQAADTGSVHVVFTEDVVGISATSAPVYASRPLFDHGNPVAGSWQCADLNGATADCLRGPVRTAVFVADQPFPASYSGPVAVVNPEHVLDVTDLAGNPAGDARRIG